MSSFGSAVTVTVGSAVPAGASASWASARPPCVAAHSTSSVARAGGQSVLRLNEREGVAVFGRLGFNGGSLDGSELISSSWRIS